MHDASDQEILRPDPRDRRRAMVLLSVGTAAGACAVVAAQAYLTGLVEQAATAQADAVARFRTFVTGCSVSISFGLLAIAVWLWSIGRQALDEERFPPSTVRVLRPTPLVTGELARHQASTILVCAILLIVAAFILPLSVVSMLEALPAAGR